MEGNTLKNLTETKSTFQQKSEFTLCVYFKNGYKKGVYFHSWKQEIRKLAGHEIKDLRYALNRLTHLVEKEFDGKYKVAILYHNPTGDVIMQWNYGHLKEKRRFKWTTKPNGNIEFHFEEEPATNPQEMMVKLTQALELKY